MSTFNDSENEKDESKSENRKWWPAWCCTPELCLGLCLALCVAALVAAVVVLAHIPLYLRKKDTTVQQRDTVPFLLVYTVNVTNVTDLMVANKVDLANKLMDKFNLQGITVVQTQLISSTVNNTGKQQSSQYNITQCQTDISTTNSVLEILFSIQYPPGCDSTSCKQNFVEGVKSDIAKSKSITGLPVTLNNGATLNTDMNLCSLTLTESSLPISALLPAAKTTITTATTSATKIKVPNTTKTTAATSTATTTIAATSATTTTTPTTTSTTPTTTTTSSITTATTTTTTTTTTTAATTTTTPTITTTSIAPTPTTTTTSIAPTPTTTTSIVPTSTTTTTLITPTSTTTTTSIATTTTDIPCSSTCRSEEACVRGICVNVGKFGVSLIWSRPGDGDIVLTIPDNKTIYWNNKGPSNNTDQGFLDRDDRVARGPENIYWASSNVDPPTGTYNGCFQPYAFNPPPSIQNPVVATITVRRPMLATITFTRTVTEKYSFDNTCYPSSNGYLGSFTYPQ